jgi:hypothetical protein
VLILPLLELDLGDPVIQRPSGPKSRCDRGFVFPILSGCCAGDPEGEDSRLAMEASNSPSKDFCDIASRQKVKPNSPHFRNGGRAVRKLLCLLVVTLIAISIEMLPPRDALAVACVNAPNTPIQTVYGANCDASIAAGNAAAYAWASNYCASRCGHVCLYSYQVQAGTLCGPSTHYVNVYGTFGCAQTTYPCPAP